MWLSYSLTLAKFHDGGLAMSSNVLRHFRLLQSEFLGCMKLKDSAQGDVTHMTSHCKFVSPTTAKTTLIFTSESKLPYKCEAPTTFSLEASLWWFSLVWFFPQRWDFSALCAFWCRFSTRPVRLAEIGDILQSGAEACDELHMTIYGISPISHIWKIKHVVLDSTTLIALTAQIMFFLLSIITPK